MNFWVTQSLRTINQRGEGVICGDYLPECPKAYRWPPKSYGGSEKKIVDGYGQFRMMIGQPPTRSNKCATKTPCFLGMGSIIVDITQLGHTSKFPLDPGCLRCAQLIPEMCSPNIVKTIQTIESSLQHRLLQ